MTDNFSTKISLLASELKANVKDLRINSLITILYVGDIINATVDKWMKKYNANQTMLGIMYLLVINGGTMGPTDISKIMPRSKQAITLGVDNLCRAGLVTRAPISGDRRTRYVQVTEKGLRFVKRTLALRQDLVFQTMSCLSEKEMEQMSSILRKLGDKILEEIARIPTSNGSMEKS